MVKNTIPNIKKILLLLGGIWLTANTTIAQQIPAVEEGIPYLITFGKDASTSWGDDDFSQTFFFVIPQFYTQPIYIRVFDPDVSGKNDEVKGDFNSKTKFSVYGGKTCFTAKDVRSNQPVGNYKSGNLLASKIFGFNEIYDQKWYTFGPFNPTEGEYVDAYGGFIFKIIAEGISGDDGNVYRYFLSSSPTENKAVEGGNAFTFEYTLRFDDDLSNVAHIYPYIEQNVVSVKLSNFDFDDACTINIVSITKKNESHKASGENVWSTIEHTITEEEKNTTLDIQFIKNKKLAVKNNNVTLYISNQYGYLLPIFTVPIGGAPQHNYKIDFNQKKKTTPY
jgi:hypothetical protein